jgi:hypothetical protein
MLLYNNVAELRQILVALPKMTISAWNAQACQPSGFRQFLA